MKAIKLTILSFMFLFYGLSSTTNAQQTLYGDTAALGNGIVYTWAHYNAQGTRDRIGLSLTQGVLNNLPQSEIDRTLSFPRLGTDTLFNHVFLNWGPSGHPPGVWNLPHFDMHFMMVSIAERQAVVAGRDSAFLPQYIPPDYFKVTEVLPRMGSHWADSTSPEWHNQTFTKTMIYGFYRYRMFFLEPMITRAYLLTNPNDSLIIKQPEQYLRTGYFPTRYTISYDASNQRYNIVLRDFVFRVGIPVGVQNIGVNIPDNFTVYQNYPNPFNPTTKIKFALPTSSFAKLVVYDMLGREIETLVNEQLNAGTYEADWSAAQFSSGVYYYKLVVDGGSTGLPRGYVETKKMVLMK